MIKSMIRFAVTKSSLNHLFLLFILVLSVFSYNHIPKEIFPPAQLDKVTITGSYVGASTEVLDKMVVDAIEEKVKNLSDIVDITTAIKNGYFAMTANIRSGSNNEQVLSDIKDIITQIKPDLPSDMNEPTAKIIEQSIPLVQIAIAGDVSLKELIAYGEELKEEVASLNDLSKVQIYGQADDELVLKVDSKKIAAFGLNYDQVVQALSGISSIFPVGMVEERGEHLYISTSNGEQEKAKVERMILSVGGKKIRIEDIAEVSFELSDVTEISHFDGKRNVSLNVAKSKEGNAIALVKQIRQILKKYELKNPTIRYQVYSDTSVWIKNRLNTVVSNIFFGLFLVFVAMFLSVNSGIAFVVALGIPLSFMIGIITADWLGYSLNLISLLGALMALGMLVDEAIVVAENIYRHLEEGKDRIDAVVDGAAEMFPAVLTATLTTVFAFLPLLLMSGDIGVFIKIMPLMISVLLLSSLFEAFYFLPLHAKDFLKVRHHEAKSHSVWNTIKEFYEKMLRALFKRKKWSLFIITITILMMTVVMIKNSKFQFFPEFDSTQINISGQVNINNSIHDTEKLVKEVEDILLKKLDYKDEVEHMTTVVGFRLDAKNQPDSNSYYFHIFIDLYEKNPENIFDAYINPSLSPAYDPSRLKRDRDAKVLVAEMIEWLKPLEEKTVDGAKVFEEFTVFSQKAGVVTHDFEVGFKGNDDAKILKAIELLESKLNTIDGLQNIANDASRGTDELKLRLNAYGSSLGFTEGTLSSALRSKYLKAEYAKMFGKEGIMPIKIEGSNKDTVASLSNFELMLPSGKGRVLLRDIADFEKKQTFSAINKEDGERVRSIFCDFDKKKITSIELNKQLKSTLDEIRKMGVVIKEKGEAQQNAQAMADAGRIALIALFLIFITLVWMFDSMVLSAIVLSTIPLSIFGVLAGHIILGLNMTIFGIFGIIGLAGVVVNDGLIMVDFIKKATHLDEVIHYAKMRIRPIILTSVTTVLGLSTLIFFASGQSLILQPMAVALGFGVAWATVLNLLYIPVLFAVVKRVNYLNEDGSLKIEKSFLGKMASKVLKLKEKNVRSTI